MRRLLLVSVAGLIATGCAGIQVNKAEVSAARRVAIVGYQGTLSLGTGAATYNPVTAGIGAGKRAADVKSGNMGARRAEQALSGYGELARRLNTTFGWEVIGREAFASVPEYQEKVAKGGGNLRASAHLIEGVLSTSQMNTWKPEQLAALATALGVDAVATIDISYTTGKTGGVTVGGMGSQTRYPVASSHFKVTNKAGQVIWEDWVAKGVVTSQGLRNTMGADIVENETEVILEATNTSLDAVIARYQSAEDSNKDKAAAAPAAAPAPATEEKKDEAAPAPAQ